MEPEMSTPARCQVLAWIQDVRMKQRIHTISTQSIRSPVPANRAAMKRSFRKLRGTGGMEASYGFFASLRITRRKDSAYPTNSSTTFEALFNAASS
jgi:hypothetical protein